MSGTLPLEAAARFLKLSPEALRRKAKAGVIPGATVGNFWCAYGPGFVDALRSRHARFGPRR